MNDKGRRSLFLSRIPTVRERETTTKRRRKNWHKGKVEILPQSRGHVNLHVYTERMNDNNKKDSQ